jgi:uncharacterized protein YihD (DUF1040 family)
VGDVLNMTDRELLDIAKKIMTKEVGYEPTEYELLDHIIKYYIETADENR